MELCECLDNQPVKITTQFLELWHQWTAKTTGLFRQCWEDKITQSNRLKFRFYPHQLPRKHRCTSDNVKRHLNLDAETTYAHSRKNVTSMQQNLANTFGAWKIRTRNIPSNGQKWSRENHIQNSPRNVICACGRNTL